MFPCPPVLADAVRVVFFFFFNIRFFYFRLPPAPPSFLSFSISLEPLSFSKDVVSFCCSNIIRFVRRHRCALLWPFFLGVLPFPLFPPSLFPSNGFALASTFETHLHHASFFDILAIAPFSPSFQLSYPLSDQQAGRPFNPPYPSRLSPRGSSFRSPMNLSLHCFHSLDTRFTSQPFQIVSGPKVEP